MNEEKDVFVFNPDDPPVRFLLDVGIPEERLREIAEEDAKDIEE